MSDIGSNAMSGALSGLAQWVLKMQSHWSDNRKHLEKKWNKNRNAFLGISDGCWKSSETDAWRSNTFINSTHQKVFGGYSIVIDMLLQGGAIPFSLKPSPDTIKSMASMDQQGQDIITAALKSMESRIRQQFDETNSDRTMMKLALCSATYGVAFAKKVRQNVVQESWSKQVIVGPDGQPVQDAGLWEIVKDEKVAPGWGYASPWEMFWDIEENDYSLKKGQGVCQVRMVSPHYLRSKIGKKFFNDETILTVLRQARGKIQPTMTTSQNQDSLPPSLRDVKHRLKTIRWVEFYGRAPKEEVEQYEKDLALGNTDYALPTLSVTGDNNDMGDEVEVIVYVADDQIIRYVRSTPEERPYLMGVWEEDLDGSSPRSVADNTSNAQLVLNGTFRAIEENAKLAGNVIIATKDEFIANMPKTIKPGTRLSLTADCDDARKALQSVVIPSVISPLIDLLQITERYLDDDSLIPKISQGISIEDKPETAYELSQRIEKSGKYIGSVIRNFDEQFIEPMVRDLYHYNMIDPDYNDGKGSYQIQALGFTSFQDRVVRINKLQQFLQIVLQNPTMAAEVDIRYMLTEISKALDCDPDLALKSNAEKQEEMAAMQAQAEQQVQMDAQVKQAQSDHLSAQAEALKAKANKDRVDAELAPAKAVHDMGIRTAELIGKQESVEIEPSSL